jgi:hypothetical protein
VAVAAVRGGPARPLLRGVRGFGLGRPLRSSQQERVRDYVLHHAPRTFQIADIRAALPGVSDQTIRLALPAVKDAGEVEADSVGRDATWTGQA